MKSRLIDRVKNLENANLNQHKSHVLFYDPTVASRKNPRATLLVWISGIWQPGINPSKGLLSCFKGRFLLCPDFGSDVKWEIEAIKQQRELMALARSRTK